MKSIDQSLPDRLGIGLIASAFAIACTGSVYGQEKIQPEIQFKPPTQEVEVIDKEKLEKEKSGKDNKTKATTPSDLKEDKAVSPRNLKTDKTVSPSDRQRLKESPAVRADELPAVQKEKLPAVQKDRLPAVQKNKLPAVHKDPATGGFVPNEAARETIKESLPSGTADADAPGRLQGAEIQVDGVDFLARPTGEPIPGRGAATGSIAVSGVNFIAHAEPGTGGASAGTAGAGPITIGAVNFIATPLPGEPPSRSASESNEAGIRINSVHFIATPVSGR